MSIQEVCRLCLSKDNLVWVFDKRLERTDHMKDVILITTGVEIHSKDVISQKICTKCGQDAIKMFQFRQQSLKNDRYLKAQCRDLLKLTDLRIPNTNVTIKTERIDKEEVKQEPPRRPSYKVHPTMTALSRKYPQMQFPSICLLSNVDPSISMEMDTVENYFKSRKLNMRKYVQLALRASDNNIPKKSPTITKYSAKITEYPAKNTIADYVAPSTPKAISKTVCSTEVVHKVSPINIKLNQSGYTIVRRPSAENIIHSKVKNVYDPTSLCKQLTPHIPESQIINESKKRRLSDNDFLSEPQTQKVRNAQNPNTAVVQTDTENKSPPVFKCKICSSVQFSAKQLKRHQVRHSRCKFCKLQFKSVAMKRQHIIHSCLVKEALDSMPDVEIERVELNKNVRLHYQEAFTAFPPLPGMEKIGSSSKSTEADEEIIEIMSDDEANSLPAKQICSRNVAPTTFHKNPPPPTVIKPDVRIKNDKVLDSILTQASELEIIKELITKIREPQSVPEATQTELPKTELIQVNKENCTIELNNLKQVLCSYQIPVKIQNGSLNALYNDQSIPRRSKTLLLWNDLAPIDFETENSLISSQIANSNEVTETPATHSNILTNGIDLIHKNKSCDSFNKEQTPLQNTEIVIPTRLNHSKSSDSPQTKSYVISNQTECLITTPECPTAIQSEPPTTSTQSSFSKQIQYGKNVDSPYSISNSLEVFPVQSTSSINNKECPTAIQSEPSTTASTQSSFSKQIQYGKNFDSPYSISNSLEVYPVQATSSINNNNNIVDIPIRRNSPNSLGTDQTTPHVSSHSLEIYSVQATPSIPNIPGGGNSSSVATTASQNDAYINSELLRKTPVQNKSDVNANFNPINTQSEAMDCSVTRQELTNKAIEYVFNNSSEIVETDTINVRPSNGVIYSNNNQQHSSISRYKKPKNIMNNRHRDFLKETVEYSNTHFPPTWNSSIGNHKHCGNNMPIQRMELNDNNVFIKPPPPYPVNQTHSYISSRTNTRNVPHSGKTRQTNGYYSAYHQYIAQRQELRSPAVRPAIFDSLARQGKIGYFPASDILRSSLQHPRVTEPSYCHVFESSVTFPDYSKTSNHVNATSVIVRPVDKSCDVSNRQLPITTCVNSSTLAACDTLTNSVPSTDKSKHFTSGLIRVKNVCELT